MIQRIVDLCGQLSAGALQSDQLGNDVDQVATALQALTMVFAAREARAAVARWERTQSGDGRALYLRTDNPPTPEEVAHGERNIREMVEARQAPAADVFNPESTTLRKPNGAPIESRGDYKAEMARRGLVNVSGYDIRNSDAAKQKAEVEKQQDAKLQAMLEQAYEFGRRSGQINSDGTVPHGAPVIPMPIDPSVRAIKAPREVEPTPATADQRPLVEHIPLEKRKRVNTDALMSNLVGQALKHSAATAGGMNGVSI